MVSLVFTAPFISNPRPLIAPSPNPPSRLLWNIKKTAVFRDRHWLTDDRQSTLDKHMIKNSPTSFWVMSPIDSYRNQHDVWQILRNTAEPPISRIYCLAKAFVSHTKLHEYVPTTVSRRLFFLHEYMYCSLQGHGQRDQRGVAPADCLICGKWGLFQYIWKVSFLGWLVGLLTPVQYIFVLLWLI